MATDGQKAAEDNCFDQSAQLYDEIHGSLDAAELTFMRDLLRRSGVPEEGRILELGVGTGRFMLPLCDEGSRRGVGVDLSVAMLGQCRAKLGAGGAFEHLKDRVELVETSMAVADAAIKPENQFDAVLIMTSSIHCLPDERQVAATVALCAAYVKRGGVVVLDVANNESMGGKRLQGVESTTLKDGGSLDLVFRRYASTDGRHMIEEWHGFINRDAAGYSEFTQRFGELVIPHATLDGFLETAGLTIEHTFGNRKGGEWNPAKSFKRVIVCRPSAAS